MDELMRLGIARDLVPVIILFELLGGVPAEVKVS